VRTLQYFQKNFKLIFCPWKLKKTGLKSCYKSAQTFFFTVEPRPQSRIGPSYYRYVPRLICLLICGLSLKSSLSMKILSINNFTTKLLSKLHSNLCIGVHLKGTKKFGSKVINRQFFHRKTVFHTKILSITNFTTKLLSIKNYFVNGPQ
jgi:hypothetical protein